MKVNQRDLERVEYERVLDFAIKSSKLEINDDYCSDLLSIAPNDYFSMKKFIELHINFDLFLDLCYTQKLNLMISGSSVLNVSNGISCHKWKPMDIDMYLHSTCDQQQTLKDIDKILRNIYQDYTIRLIRTPYILSWFIIQKNIEFTNYKPCNIVICSYQLILSPCLRWEHVFAGYHTDMVCAGYLCMHKQFVISTRYKHWKKTNYSSKLERYDIDYTRYISFEGINCFFPDLVSPRYRDRVVTACEKYLHRGYACHFVQPFEELYIFDIERSGIDYTIQSLLDNNECDEALHLAKLQDVESYGNTLCEVYHGESFSTIIETMSCFRKCPGGCNNFIICERDTPTGCFCGNCFDVEQNKLRELEHILQSNQHMTSLVTGARCGLGKEIKTLMNKHSWKVYGTTRFVNLTNNNNMLKLDLKDPDTWKQTQHLLENGDINVLVLSASETLHYPDDDKGSYDKDTIELDWTNDIIRKNTGLWHKTLDQHSYQEIISPLMVNVAGTSSLLASFLKGVNKIRSEEAKSNIKQESFFCCIVVTSFEGRFEEKTPFHPITNACKSAIEQVVWTVKAQARFLNCSVMLSDPGWVYTESSFGKIPGPVPIKFGISQILQPLVISLTEYKTKNVVQKPFVFRRNIITESNHYIFKSTKVTIQLKPCLCLVNINKGDFVYNCTTCGDIVLSRDVFNYDCLKVFVDIAKSHNLDKNVINIILGLAKYPLL